MRDCPFYTRVRQHFGSPGADKNAVSTYGDVDVPANKMDEGDEYHAWGQPASQGFALDKVWRAMTA